MVEAGDAIEAMGGTRLVFAAVDGQRKYSLVGGSPYKTTAVEMSNADPKNEDRLVGGLARGHDMSFSPTEAGPLNGINAQLLGMAYQAPKPFPALDSPAQQAAETYLGVKSSMCPIGSTTCDFRPKYYRAILNDIKHRATTLAESRLWPGPGKAPEILLRCLTG